MKYLHRLIFSLTFLFAFLGMANVEPVLAQVLSLADSLGTIDPRKNQNGIAEFSPGELFTTHKPPESGKFIGPKTLARKKLSYSGRWKGAATLYSTTCIGTKRTLSFRHSIRLSGKLVQIRSSDGGLFYGQVLKNGAALYGQASGQASSGYVDVAIVYANIQKKGSRTIAGVAIGARLTSGSLSCEATWHAIAKKV